jgi:hypothetical protein
MSVPQPLNWPPELGTSGGSIMHWVHFQAHAFKEKNLTTDIALFIPPDAMSTGYKSDYKNLEMGSGGAAALKAAQSGKGTAGSIWETAAAYAEGTFGSGLSELSSKILQEALPEQLAAMAARHHGKVVNPNIVSDYQGPTSQREHKFTFKMMPKSETESKTVRNIVRGFKVAMLPSGGDANSPTAPIGMFGYPDEWKIKFTINGREEGESEDSSIFKIGKSVLTDIGLDYSTQDTVAFYEGTSNPVTTEMVLTFQEIGMMHRTLAEMGF